MCKKFRSMIGGIKDELLREIGFRTLVNALHHVLEWSSRLGVLGLHNTSDYHTTIVVVSLIVIVVPLLSPYCYYCAP